MEEGLVVKKLVIGGSSDIIINDDGTIKGVKEYTLDDGELRINAKKSGGTNIVIGSLGATLIGGSTSISNVGGGGIVTINGKRVNLDQLPDAVEEPDKDVKLDPASSITFVVLSGAASLWLPLSGRYVSTKRLNVIVSGSADVHLPSIHFKSLSVKVSGTGNVQGRGACRCDTISIQLSGMGNIEDIHVLEDGDVAVSGMGHVQLKAKNPKSVQKHISGMGSVSIKKFT